jgi:hypothetical protein
MQRTEFCLLQNSRIADQKMSRTLQKPKVHYRVHKNPPLDPTPSQMSPIHNLFLQIYFNIILSTHGSAKQSFPSLFSN